MMVATICSGLASAGGRGPAVVHIVTEADHARVRCFVAIDDRIAIEEAEALAPVRDVGAGAGQKPPARLDAVQRRVCLQALRPMLGWP